MYLSAFTFLLWLLLGFVDFEWWFTIVLTLTVGGITCTIPVLQFVLFLLLNVLYDLGGYRFECVFDSLPSLGTCLKKLHPILLSCFLALFLANDSFVFYVAFISQQYFLHVRLRVIIYLTDPITNVIKALLASGVIGKDDTLRPPIIGLRDRAESLLAGRVPYLDLHVFPVQLNCVDLEINTFRTKNNIY